MAMRIIGRWVFACRGHQEVDAELGSRHFWCQEEQPRREWHRMRGAADEGDAVGGDKWRRRGPSGDNQWGTRGGPGPPGGVSSPLSTLLPPPNTRVPGKQNGEWGKRGQGQHRIWRMGKGSDTEGEDEEEDEEVMIYRMRDTRASGGR